MDMLRHGVHHFGDRFLDRVTECDDIGASMALDDCPIQPNEACAVVASMVHFFPERGQYRPRGKSAKTGEQAAVKGLPQRVRDHLCQPFARLQCNIADKAVADNDVNFASIDGIALDVSDVIETTTLQ